MWKERQRLGKRGGREVEVVRMWREVRRGAGRWRRKGETRDMQVSTKISMSKDRWNSKCAEAGWGKWQEERERERERA